MNNGIIKTTGSGFDVVLSDEAQQIKLKVLKDSSFITKIDNDEIQQVAVNVLRDLKGVLKRVETSRKHAKEPALEFGKRIDSLAKTFVSEMEAESERISRLAGAYEAEKLRLSREEEDRRKEEVRKIEEELAKERLAKMQAVIDAKGEKARLEAELALKKQQEAEEDKKKAMMFEMAPKPMVKAEGSIVREDFEIQIFDIHALYAYNRACVRMEPALSEIKDMLKLGIQNIPGVRFSKVTTVGARA